MTPAQLHDALANGLTAQDIEDQEAEDEAFERLQPVQIRPHMLLCGGRYIDFTVARACLTCRRLREDASGEVVQLPDLVGDICPVRVQA